MSPLWFELAKGKRRRVAALFKKMSAATEIITEQARTKAISVRWIINAREDLIWFVGSVASSFALLILYVTGVLPLIPMVAGWAILIDAPHVFGTFSRTYFDRSEWRTRKRLLLGSLLFFIVGPAMVLLGVGLVFFFVAALWAYYHLVKQHYGFMVLYKKKNNDLAPVDNALDRVFLMFAFNYPFVQFIASDPSAMARVPTVLHGGVNALAMLLLAGTIVVGEGVTVFYEHGSHMTAAQAAQLYEEKKRGAMQFAREIYSRVSKPKGP